MREDAPEVPTESVKVSVFGSHDGTSELSAFLSKVDGLQAEGSAYVYCSTGKSGGYFPLVKITGSINAIAAALAAYFESRKKKFWLVAEEGKITVGVENYSAKELVKILSKAKSLQIKESADELATFGCPEETFKSLKGFSEGQPSLEKPN